MSAMNGIPVAIDKETHQEDNSQEDGHPIRLRDKVQPPARFRQQATPDSQASVAISRDATKTKRRSNSVASHTTESRANTPATAVRRSALKKHKPETSKTPLVLRPATSKYPDAAFPSLPTNQQVESADAKGIRGIHEWVEQDDGWSWEDILGSDDIEPAARERHMRMALEGRAKRAFVRGQTRTASFFRQEMSLSSKIADEAQDLTLAEVKFAIRKFWPVVAVNVFGEDPVALRRHIAEIDVALNSSSAAGKT